MPITKEEYGLFCLTEIIYKKGAFEKWQSILHTHDTYGLPFDLIYLKLKESTNLIPEEWNSENFTEFLNLFRNMDV